jgi:alpha-1,2-mannosyltransferase
MGGPAKVSRLRQLEDRLFTARSLRLGAVFLVVVSLLDLARLYFSGQWIFDTHGKYRLLDFAWLWLGGGFALRASAVQAFNDPLFAAAQQELVGAIGPDQVYFHWVYPPVLFFLALPLAALPYLPALIVWCATTGAFYVSAIARILGRGWVLLALAPSAVVVNLMLGQTGYLSAGIMGYGLLLLNRKPFLAGLLLSLFAYKPQLALLFPIVLAVAGSWRAIAGGALGVLALVGASAAAFGPGSWLAFAEALSLRNPRSLTADPGLHATLQTVFGVARDAGLDFHLAWAAQISAGVMAAVLCCFIWRRPLPYELKAAALAAAALLATPYLLAYDLVIAVVPAAFLIRLGLMGGFLPGERLVLLGAFMILLAYVFPVGPFVFAALLALVLRRALVRPFADASVAPPEAA